jgi:hypothetical protein
LVPELDFRGTGGTGGAGAAGANARTKKQ